MTRDFLVPVTVLMPTAMLGRIQGVARRHEAEVGPLIVELVRRQLVSGGTAQKPPRSTGGHRGGVRTLWTEQHAERLRVLWSEKKTDAAIAEELGFSAGTIRKHRNALGLARNHVGRPSVWTPELEQQLRDLHAVGTSDNKIAQALGVAFWTVSEKRKQLGLPAHFIPFYARPIAELEGEVVADAS